MGAAAGCQVEPGPFGGVKMVVGGGVGRSHTLAATNFGAAAHLLGGICWSTATLPAGWLAMVPAAQCREAGEGRGILRVGSGTDYVR